MICFLAWQLCCQSWRGNERRAAARNTSGVKIMRDYSYMAVQSSALTCRGAYTYMTAQSSLCAEKTHGDNSPSWWHICRTCHYFQQSDASTLKLVDLCILTMPQRTVLLARVLCMFVLSVFPLPQQGQSPPLSTCRYTCGCSRFVFKSPDYRRRSGARPVSSGKLCVGKH